MVEYGDGMFLLFVAFGVALLFAGALFAILAPPQVKSGLWTLLGTLWLPLIAYAFTVVVFFAVVHGEDGGLGSWLTATAIPLSLFVFNVWRTSLPLWAKIIALLIGVPSLFYIFIYLPFAVPCAVGNCL